MFTEGGEILLARLMAGPCDLCKYRMVDRALCADISIRGLSTYPGLRECEDSTHPLTDDMAATL